MTTYIYPSGKGYLHFRNAKTRYQFGSLAEACSILANRVHDMQKKAQFEEHKLQKQESVK